MVALLLPALLAAAEVDLSDNVVRAVGEAGAGPREARAHMKPRPLPEVASWRVVKSYPHDAEAFTYACASCVASVFPFAPLVVLP